MLKTYQTFLSVYGPVVCLQQPVLFPALLKWSEGLCWTMIISLPRLEQHEVLGHPDILGEIS